MRFLRRLGFVYVSAYILMFFSEYFFLNESPTEGISSVLIKNPIEALWILEGILWYAVPAYIFIIAIHRFHVKDLWALILSGSLYGFIIEGIIANQIYEGLPWTISWTPLGWHVVIDVLTGWWFMRKLLAKNKLWLTGAVAIGLGLFWGIWATWTATTGEPLMPVEQYITFTFFTGILLVISYKLQDTLLTPNFTINKVEEWIVWILVGVLTIVMTINMFPFPIVVFIPLMLFTLYLLKRNPDSGESYLIMKKNSIKTSNVLMLILLPITASIVYSLYYPIESKLSIVEPVVIPLTLLGFLFYDIAIFKVFTLAPKPV